MRQDYRGGDDRSSERTTADFVNANHRLKTLEASFPFVKEHIHHQGIGTSSRHYRFSRIRAAFPTSDLR